MRSARLIAGAVTSTSTPWRSPPTARRWPPPAGTGPGSGMRRPDALLLDLSPGDQTPRKLGAFRPTADGWRSDTQSEPGVVVDAARNSRKGIHSLRGLSSQVARVSTSSAGRAADRRPVPRLADCDLGRWYGVRVELPPRRSPRRHRRPCGSRVQPRLGRRFAAATAGEDFQGCDDVGPDFGPRVELPGSLPPPFTTR